MEVAMQLKKLNKNLEILVIDKHDAPLKKVLGKEIGDKLKLLYEMNGIKFKLEKKVTSISEVDKANKDNKMKKIYIESCKKEESNGENELSSFNKRDESSNKTQKNFIFGDMIIFATGDSPNCVLLVFFYLYIFFYSNFRVL